MKKTLLQNEYILLLLMIFMGWAFFIITCLIPMEQRNDYIDSFIPEAGAEEQIILQSFTDVPTDNSIIIDLFETKDIEMVRFYHSTSDFLISIYGGNELDDLNVIWEYEEPFSSDKWQNVYSDFYINDDYRYLEIIIEEDIKLSKLNIYGSNINPIQSKIQSMTTQEKLNLLAILKDYILNI